MLVAIVFLFPLLLNACAGNGGDVDVDAGPAAAAPPIDKLELLTPPTALNLDEDRPGPDGFGASVYAVRNDPFGLVPINSGVLDILLFEGVLTRNEIREAEPRQTWSFTPGDLVAARQRTTVGVGYGFTLAWDREPPFEHDDVTVVARYTPPDEAAPAVYSAPVSLSLRAR